MGRAQSNPSRVRGVWFGTTASCEWPRLFRSAACRFAAWKQSNAGKGAGRARPETWEARTCKVGHGSDRTAQL